MNRFLSTKDIQKLEDEKKRNDMQAAHASNCQLFGLDPCTTRPIDTPYHINAISGDFYSIDGRNLPIPPISSKWQQLAANQLKPSEQDPKNYILPKMELPDQSKCSLDNRGKIFEKKRESPIEIRPLDTEEDSSSDTDTEDTEEEELKQQLEFLKSIYKKKMQKIDPQKVNDFKKELEMDEKTNLLVKDLADAGLIPNRKANAEEQPRKKKKHRRQGLTEVRLFQVLIIKILGKLH